MLCKESHASFSFSGDLLSYLLIEILALDFFQETFIAHILLDATMI